MRAVDLWNRIIAGDEDAVELLCERYQARFEFICHRRGIPRDDCPDVALEALAAAAFQIRDGRFRQESSLETWLRRILQFKIADYWRRNQTARCAARTGSSRSPRSAWTQTCSEPGDVGGLALAGAKPTVLRVVQGSPATLARPA